MKTLRNNKGFSMIEVILALVMGAMILGITTESMLNNVDSYTFIANRKAALGDARYAMNRISTEIIAVNTGNITGTGSTEITFVDDAGNTVWFHLAQNDGSLGIFRGPDLLVDKVQGFTLEYFDANGNQLLAGDAATPVNARRIKYTITTDPEDNEGSITLTTLVTPRDFIGYNNYQQ